MYICRFVIEPIVILDILFILSLARHERNEDVTCRVGHLLNALISQPPQRSTAARRIPTARGAQARSQHFDPIEQRDRLTPPGEPCDDCSDVDMDTNSKNYLLTRTVFQVPERHNDERVEGAWKEAQAAQYQRKRIIHVPYVEDDPEKDLRRSSQG